MFPLANIHEHQLLFMQEFEKQKGVAFLLLYFAEKNIFYYLRLRELETFWRRREEGGRKSFRMDELDRSFFLEGEQGVLVPYLEGLQKDLLTRD